MAAVESSVHAAFPFGRAYGKSMDGTAVNGRPLFWEFQPFVLPWSHMGVLDRSTWFAHGEESDRDPYRCVSCGQSLPVQYHSCPECGSYDIRAAKWLDD
ncbi:hypothetical protein GJ629_10705 [Halapricum sp. CBA1109]|uniref:hypothetical protein n=1 Tax=Halapricum sp. CBA1109 TaxID=2668068 RepID=UPI0012FA7466|nr:hypothetical protein [Halapricum sp. CBA1109]MUV90308.1 hypothetical protein [Halapricum sp. CBA1109]